MNATGRASFQACLIHNLNVDKISSRKTKTKRYTSITYVAHCVKKQEAKDDPLKSAFII